MSLFLTVTMSRSILWNDASNPSCYECMPENLAWIHIGWLAVSPCCTFLFIIDDVTRNYNRQNNPNDPNAPNGANGANYPAVNVRPLSDAEILSIPSIAWKEECGICLLNWAPGDRQKVLPCLHLFHPQCIYPYVM